MSEGLLDGNEDINKEDLCYFSVEDIPDNKIICGIARRNNYGIV